MRCVRPLTGHQASNGGITFADHASGPRMQVRCGRCIGCRLYRSQEWAIRLSHEAQMHDTSVFLTLTYDDENLPGVGTLQPTDHQRFLKRLRKELGPCRFFQCGEYGETTLRPHHHTILFGQAFPDAVPHSESPSGTLLFRSDTLDRIWSHGHCLIGSVTFASCQYVAKYTTKSLSVTAHSSFETHERFLERYTRVDPETGEIHEVAPESATMSNRPGIGRSWFDRYHTDVYPDDFIVLEGRKFPVPRYYDKLLEERDPSLFQEVKRQRILNHDESDDSPQRLEAMEICALARTNLYGKRDYNP